MVQKQKKKSIKEISPIDVYGLLPKTNCGECGEANCMAFATKLVNGEFTIPDCPPLLREEYADLLESLGELLAPPVRAVTIGRGEDAITIGGKHVLYRHDFTYHNQTPIAIDLADSMSEEEIVERIDAIVGFSYEYIGRELRLDAVAIRSVTDDPQSFQKAVQIAKQRTGKPFILCSQNPAVMEAGLREADDCRPLIFAANTLNWQEMAALALEYKAPLVVSAPGDPGQLRSLVKTLAAYGIDDLVLDPGTFPDEGFADTILNHTLLRKAACISRDELVGFPILGTPIAAWTGEEISPEVVQWKEAYMAAMLISRYADLLIMHSMEGWTLLPQLIWRFNIYTDPRKPVSVEPGVRTFGNPDTNSPLLITTNYALTYFTVEADIKSAHIDCHLIVVDTSGISVESAVAGRYLTSASMAEALEEFNAESLVDHRVLIIPGLAARLSGETEEASGWRVLVGPKDSSGLKRFIEERWPPKDE
ncbi:MAG: acetyl-CoA decarbonylase/synthase complex subunit gamma [Methanocalculus sp. MSAO_Arc1]|uniref:acetyl-CoA decarbonylase/synthase complex subunit gamma n=1 Tax=Methanocalculus TaxID=71151 RepID=UPI000FEE5BD3|nr:MULTISPECIES: acetyl-CoA decarbonylase/synthase complex subunit gamma [unclassified Methanocalculus]MCP1662558.1 acetyl-CoA decarbonylase/synthase complex subunit gamma [Methanocalculus sp. AMF5]RQD80070.1 MAG: acetyl-CoA decarbonylase/synthase complex subunit gamma [Methanocalculus sp. MSAO_Arc1]